VLAGLQAVGRVNGWQAYPPRRSPECDPPTSRSGPEHQGHSLTVTLIENSDSRFHDKNISYWLSENLS